MHPGRGAGSVPTPRDTPTLTLTLTTQKKVSHSRDARAALSSTGKGGDASRPQQQHNHDNPSTSRKPFAFRLMKTLSQLSSDRCTRALEVPVGESGVLQGSLSVRRLGLPSLQHAKPYLPALLTRSNARALLSLTESLGARLKSRTVTRVHDQPATSLLLREECTRGARPQLFSVSCSGECSMR